MLYRKWFGLFNAIKNHFRNQVFPEVCIYFRTRELLSSLMMFISLYLSFNARLILILSAPFLVESIISLSVCYGRKIEVV